MEKEKSPIHVGIFMGSDSDRPIVEGVKIVLEKFLVPFAATICSAHRSPDDVRETVIAWEKRGCKVFIAAAGAAAHLGGVIASHTVRPVIAVPLTQKTQSGVNGLDALLACVQMPSGIPVATMAIDGAKNAAYFAIQILAANNPALQLMLYTHKTALVLETREKAKKLKESGWPD